MNVHIKKIILIKGTFVDNFISNNNIELKFRTKLWGKLNFLNFYSKKFGFSTETVKSKTDVGNAVKLTSETDNSYLKHLPEKCVFAFTYDVDHVAQHKIKPYLGL